MPKPPKAWFDEFPKEICHLLLHAAKLGITTIQNLVKSTKSQKLYTKPCFFYTKKINYGTHINKAKLLIDSYLHMYKFVQICTLMFFTMKITGLFFLFFLCFLPLKAQTNTAEVESYKAKLQQKEAERIKKINDYVAKNNAPLNGYNEKGNYFYLHHIDDLGMPIYFVTKQNEEKNQPNITIIDTKNELTDVPTVSPITVQNQQFLQVKSNENISEIRVLNSDTKCKIRKLNINLKDYKIDISSLKSDTYVVFIKYSNTKTFIYSIKI